MRAGAWTGKEKPRRDTGAVGWGYSSSNRKTSSSPRQVRQPPPKTFVWAVTKTSWWRTSAPHDRQRATGWKVWSDVMPRRRARPSFCNHAPSGRTAVAWAKALSRISAGVPWNVASSGREKSCLMVILLVGRVSTQSYGTGRIFLNYFVKYIFSARKINSRSEIPSSIARCFARFQRSLGMLRSM